MMTAVFAVVRNCSGVVPLPRLAYQSARLPSPPVATRS